MTALSKDRYARVSRGCSSAGFALALALYSQTGNTADLSSFSARYIQTHLPSGKILVKADVDVSPVGLRMSQVDGAVTYLLNRASAKLWFLHERAGLQHEIALHERDSTDRYPVSDDLPPLPRRRLCPDHFARKREQQDDATGEIETWECVDLFGKVRSIESRLTDSKLVVRAEIPGRLRVELRNIRQREFPSGHFLPPANYLATDAASVMRGRVSLPELEFANGSAISSSSGGE